MPRMATPAGAGMQDAIKTDPPGRLRSKQRRPAWLERAPGPARPGEDNRNHANPPSTVAATRLKPMRPMTTLLDSGFMASSLKIITSRADRPMNPIRKNITAPIYEHPEHQSYLAELWVVGGS